MIYCNILNLNLKEIKDNYIKLLCHLTDAPDIPLKTFINNIHDICQNGKIIVCHVNNRIIGTGTIIYETKIIHGGKKVGHIEDVVVDPEYRGKGIASYIINMLMDDSKHNNCYKVILDCNDDTIPFYEKHGFSHKNAQMSYYHNNLSESHPLDHFK
jgi:glucosamine-phosphate N-acetyltransferase